MPVIGGMPGQILGDLKGVVESAAQKTVKAGSDIAAGTVETVIGVSQNQPMQQGKGMESISSGSDPQSQAKKKEEEKRRFEAVRSELAQYIQRRKQLDAQIAQERAAKEAQVRQQQDAREKQKKENWAAGFLKRVSSQSHGEVMKGKD